LSDVAEIAALIRSGELAVLPTDTVYGLVCTAFERQPAVDLYRLKGRDAIQPTAVLFASVDKALELIPELGEREAAILRALLPGPYTLILPNPAGRFDWLTGGRPGSIGARVPALAGPTAEIVGRLGAVVATSANLPGEPDPRVLADVPSAIVRGVVVALDGGELPGVPSTVIDVTGAEPVVLRVGIGDPEAALERIAAGGRRTLQ
jgi:L-threonylcarbamoyladenylate synthase